jgi:hypothetical protein
MGWVRMNASWDAEKRHRRVGFFGRMALRAAVLLSKERDWQHAERRGWVPREEFDAEEIARHLEALGDGALARYMTPEQLLDELTAGVAACESEGLLLVDGRDGWWIDGWETYVADPTAAARKAAERARKRALAEAGTQELPLAEEAAEDAPAAEPPPTEPPGSSRGVTVGHSDTRDAPPPPAAPVTVGHCDEPTSATVPAAPSAAQAGHGDSRDVTLRYVTERTTSYPPTPAGAGAGGPRVRRLTPAEQAVALVIAEAVERGDVDVEPPAERREFEKRLDKARRAVRAATTGNERGAAEKAAKLLEDEHGAAVRLRRSSVVELLRTDAARCWDLVMRWRVSDQPCGKPPHRVPLRVACSAAQRAVEQTERGARRSRAGEPPLPFTARPEAVRKAAHA